MSEATGDQPCVFCRIVDGEIPADVVHSDDDVVAFRDSSPKAEVHVLVVPRAHVTDVTDLVDDPALLAALVRTAGEVAEDFADGDFRLVFNTGAGAGQTVFHAHAHVLAGRGAAAVGL
ncbi:HIT domain-containing protein [Aquipuribacter sp. SD81]|uniref:HIT domain-containing protein n=1 Tax=Aquipuribacter sp. SD81 TaxID=3127703 RepID=UPI0030170A17